MTAAQVNLPRRTRVLFLAWGYSVHAERRIRPFVEDDRFEVGVASTHDYAFEGARNFLLSGRGVEGADVCGRRSFAERVRARIRHALVGIFYRILARRDPQTGRPEVEKWLGDREALLAAAGEFRPDVVFLQTLLYPCYLSFSLPRAIPIVITFWNGDVVWWAKWNGLERLFKKWIVAYGARRARAITVNSRTAAEACFAYGAAAERVHHLPYPGVDASRFSPRKKGADRETLGIAERPVVLCPRGTAGYLNGDVVVAAAEAVARKFPDVLFLILSASGDETEFDAHRKTVRKGGLERNFRWEGRVPWEAMPAYYGAADAMVSVSSNDSLPNCMLEAMACGVPVVMGDIPAIREWVEDGRNGFLVPPRDPSALADALIRLLGDGGEATATFARINRARILETVDSRRNLERVKELVLSIADVK